MNLDNYLKKRFPAEGDYPEDDRDVFVSYEGEPCIGYYCPEFNERKDLGGHFYLTNSFGHEDRVIASEVDYFVELT